MLACLGGALIWRQATDADRGRWRKLSRDSLQARARGPGRAGCAPSSAPRWCSAAASSCWRRPTSPRCATGSCCSMVGAGRPGPAHRAVVDAAGHRSCAPRRSERIRSQERADIAAHLHDSVLQTLALIQRNASSPREVVPAGARAGARTAHAALRRAHRVRAARATSCARTAAEVEDAYAIGVDVVIVGDARDDRRTDRRDRSGPRGAGERGQARAASPPSRCTRRSNRRR